MGDHKKEDKTEDTRLSDLDRQMEEAIREQNRKLDRKIEKRKKSKNLGKVLITVFAAALLAVAVIALINVILPDTFGNEEEFREFASDELKSSELCDTHSKSELSCEYDSNFSVAVRKNETDSDLISHYRDRKIKRIINKCDRDNVTALIVDARCFDSDNGATSMYIMYREYVMGDREIEFSHSGVSTYVFNSDTGRAVDALQVMNVNYKSLAAEYASEYFDKTYGEEDLKTARKQYTCESEDNFNSFIIDGKDVVFIFDEDTVVDRKYGTVSMTMPKMFIESALRPEILDRYINPSEPMVAITYDDGPGGEAELRIIDTLYEYGSVATFFYLGNRVSSAPECGKRALKIGCEIGNHSWDHPQLSTLSKKQVRKQIKKTNSEIKKYLGVTPVVGRPPYGDFDKAVLDSCGIAEVLWTVDTLDWKTRNAKSTFRAVKKKKNLDGSIILMHSIYKETAKATELIVPWLKKHGYQTVTVSELIKYKTGKSPKPGKLYRQFN